MRRERKRGRRTAAKLATNAYLTSSFFHPLLFVSHSSFLWRWNQTQTQVNFSDSIWISFNLIFASLVTMLHIALAAPVSPTVVAFHRMLSSSSSSIIHHFTHSQLRENRGKVIGVFIFLFFLLLIITLHQHYRCCFRRSEAMERANSEFSEKQGNRFVRVLKLSQETIAIAVFRFGRKWRQWRCSGGDIWSRKGAYEFCVAG